MKHISEVMREAQWFIDLVDDNFWGACDHGVSLAPGVECEACEVREDNADA